MSCSCLVFEPLTAKVGALLGVNEPNLMIFPLILVSQASINLQWERQKTKAVQQNCGQTRWFPSAMPYRLLSVTVKEMKDWML